MADAVANEFPLFPLGLVALPGELIPLHIFEDRYRTMMSLCIETESEFGIVWLADDGLRDIEDRAGTPDPELVARARTAYADLV